MRSVPAWGLVLVSAALLFSGCFISKWRYYGDCSTESIQGWSVGFGFAQEHVENPPEGDKGDTSFVLAVAYHCIESPCGVELKIEHPVIVRRDTSSTYPLGMRCTYTNPRDSIGSIVRLGPWPRAKVPDTVTIEFDLVATDKNTRETIETKRVRVVGFPVHEKTGLIRAMVRGV